jgi:hypothetical protein
MDIATTTTRKKLPIVIAMKVTAVTLAVTRPLAVIAMTGNQYR